MIARDMSKAANGQVDLAACRFQGEVFAASRELCDCGSAVFVRRFMGSSVAALIDNGGLAMGAYLPEDAIADLDAERGASSYGSVLFSADELYWMGYIYRYWCSLRGISSKRVFQIAPSRELRSLFAAYHTLDPVQCIERIEEAHGIAAPRVESEQEMIDHGVKALREIRQRSKWEYHYVHL